MAPVALLARLRGQAPWVLPALVIVAVIVLPVVRLGG
jgi:hypothetical protein